VAVAVWQCDSDSGSDSGSDGSGSDSGSDGSVTVMAVMAVWQMAVAFATVATVVTDGSYDSRERQ
jgi:hypothetical protein